jgi:FkbM family methyltransferase
MDIGAANGAMTLIAASLGSKVFSYEPDPTMFEVTKINVELNPTIRENVLVINRALAARNSEIHFSRGSNQHILSNIVFSGERGNENDRVKVISLSEEIDQIHTDESKLVLKMDIEGAEWGILNDSKTLDALYNHRAILLLAVHPGFHRPHRKIFPVLNRILFEIWRLQNYFEAKRIFNALGRFAIIKRTNLNVIINPKVFAGMCLIGYHEFVIEFRSIKEN